MTTVTTGMERFIPSGVREEMKKIFELFTRVHALIKYLDEEYPDTSGNKFKALIVGLKEKSSGPTHTVFTALAFTRLKGSEIELWNMTANTPQKGRTFWDFEKSITGDPQFALEEFVKCGGNAQMVRRKLTGIISKVLQQKLETSSSLNLALSSLNELA